jgi:4-amino-4-deoxy-L-arabinose transferase-like glycosyltransferase
MGTPFNIVTSNETEVGGIQHKRKATFILLAFLLVGAHFVFLMFHFEPAISTPDAHSYFVLAKLLAKEGKTYIEPESVLQYLGPHWRHAEENRYFCTHAPGLSVIMAPFYAVLGPKATLWINPVLASLSLLGLFLLCRLWVGEGWGLFAAALMAANPFANEHALFGDAHSATCFLFTWGLYFVVKWTRDRSAWWAFAAGIFLGMIPSVRYAEVLLLPGVGIFVLLHLRKDKASWRSLSAGIIGAAIPIGLLCFRNQLAFGAFWRTGYGLMHDESSFFGWRYFARYSFQYLQKLMSEGCGVVFGLGVVGIGAMCARRGTWKPGVLFALLVLPLSVLYMSFFWGPDGQSMRYFLPTFYIYTIASVWLLCVFAKEHVRSAYVACLVVLGVNIWWGLPQSAQKMHGLKERNGVLAHVTVELEETVEPGSIVMASEGISQHLDFIGYWRLLDVSILRSTRLAPRSTFRPDIEGATLPTRTVRNVEAQLKYAGFEGRERFEAFCDDVWRWAGEERTVYLLGREEQIRDYEEQLSERDRLTTIKKIKLPGGRRNEVQESIGLGPAMRPPEGDTGPGSPMGPRGGMEGTMPEPPGPMGPNRIFDFVMNAEPLLLVEWTRESQ